MTRPLTTASVPTTLSLAQILDSAVVTTWSNLVRGIIPALVHVEYAAGDDCFGGDLRIWSCTPRGYWSLVVARDPNRPR